jgi:hypothetical protein
MHADIVTVAPSQARMEPPSLADAQSEKFEFTMRKTAPVPETCSGPVDARAILLHLKAVALTVMPVQPSLAWHKILSE